MIDALGYCLNKRRSAVLTHIVTSFLEGAMTTGRHETAKRKLLDFLEDCRDGVEAKPELVKHLLSDVSQPQKKKA
ncbi:hypothetical protein DF3PB_470017 [uncultured Defluviicoccus sp.]|uniref:Uncharacterized protein n=1 Tax=metagenome TaxID=256318 RepID=A0A380TH19_9ZZZZ|nr:hypothetical protein DF3PB_470017 [uncultured Defluviicoccus sp.]